MTIWRARLPPFYPASLIFVGLSAPLLAVTALAGYEGAILRIIPAFFVLSWLFKYAYSVLENAANGLAEPPVPSVDMLGPFETRPLLQLLLCVAVYEVADQIGGAPKMVILTTSSMNGKHRVRAPHVPHCWHTQYQRRAQFS